MNGDKKLGFFEKAGFGLFSTASNVIYNFKSLFYLFFLTNVLQIDIKTAGIVITLGTVWDAVNDPLVGFWAVNHKFKSGERCRPFALWFALPLAVSIVMLFTDFGIHKTLAAMLSLAIYFIFELFNTLVAIPYNSMGSLATRLDSQRRSINVYRNIGGIIGTAIGSVAILPLLKALGALDKGGNVTPSSANGFFLAAILMGVVCIVGALAHYFTTKERVKPLASDEPKLKVKEVFGMLTRCRPWLINALYVILYGVGNVLLMSCVNYYATYVLGSTLAATNILIVYMVVALATSFIVSPIDHAIGRKNTMLLGAGVAVVGKLWFIIQPSSLAAIYVNAATVAVSATIAFVMFNTNRNNIVDLIEWRDGRRLDSLVSTADNLASKLASAGASALITFSLGAAGYDGTLTTQPIAAIHTIEAMLGWVPMIVSVLMFIVVLFLNIEKESKQMNAEKEIAGK